MKQPKMRLAYLRHAIANPAGTFSLVEPMRVARSSAGESEGRVSLFNMARVDATFPSAAKQRGNL